MKKYNLKKYLLALSGFIFSGSVVAYSALPTKKEPTLIGEATNKKMPFSLDSPFKKGIPSFGKASTSTTFLVIKVGTLLSGQPEFIRVIKKKQPKKQEKDSQSSQKK